MTLTLHDTLSGAKRPFSPLDPGHVRMYVCGPTVYNRVHIGNARPAVVFDVLYRWLRQRWPKVTYVRNITDIDDKINAAAREAGEPISELAERYAAAYAEDMAALGNLAPSLAPRATHHIAEIIDMIGRLIDAEHAYEAEGHVLFSVTSDPGYGRLSHRSLEDMIAGARVEVAPYKRHEADFVLWKPSSDDQPGWDSPWGRGRPGWHIECSAMIEKHLGEVIDIHGGGNDLTFPHHENELAQSSCAHGRPEFVGHWVHNGMINVNGEKMSKSLGNFVTIAELLQRHDGEVIRYALLSGHYRAPLNFSDELLEQSRASLERLYGALRRAGGGSAEGDALPETFVAALDDDLNTPGALAELHALASRINTASDAADIDEAAAGLRACASVLGLLQQDPEAFFQRSGATDLSPERIEALIAERAQARADRDFTRADAIRDELAAMGVELEDGAEGTRWRVKG